MVTEVEITLPNLAGSEGLDNITSNFSLTSYSVSSIICKHVNFYATTKQSEGHHCRRTKLEKVKRRQINDTNTILTFSDMYPDIAVRYRLPCLKFDRVIFSAYVISLPLLPAAVLETVVHSTVIGLEMSPDLTMGT